MKSKAYVLDTSVVIEYIDQESKYRDKVEKLYRLIAQRRVKAYVSSVTLSEVLHVAARAYDEAGSTNPNEDAIDFIKWLQNYPNIEIVDVNPEISLLAGELRKSLRISLIDCHVIATAKALRAKPLFLHVEKEMSKYFNELKKCDVEFLTQLELPLEVD